MCLSTKVLRSGRTYGCSCFFFFSIKIYCAQAIYEANPLVVLVYRVDYDVSHKLLPL